MIWTSVCVIWTCARYDWTRVCNVWFERAPEMNERILIWQRARCIIWTRVRYNLSARAVRFECPLVRYDLNARALWSERACGPIWTRARNHWTRHLVWFEHTRGMIWTRAWNYWTRFNMVTCARYDLNAQYGNVHQKMTSQNRCPFDRRTFSFVFRAKKRLYVVKWPKNHQKITSQNRCPFDRRTFSFVFRAKNDCILWNDPKIAQKWRDILRKQEITY